MSLILRQLTKDDKISFTNSLLDWKTDLIWDIYNWNKDWSYEEMLSVFYNEHNGISLKDGQVLNTTLFGFIDNIIVGRLSIRHSLNDSLIIYGGHVGYAVSEKYRNQGIASDMLRQAIPICNSFGISKILLTCADDNIASIKVIEKCGGKIENIIWNESLKRFTRRYWI
jgi:predicted acetyltransferase